MTLTIKMKGFIVFLLRPTLRLRPKAKAKPGEVKFKTILVTKLSLINYYIHRNTL